MNAEIITVGEEILTGLVVNTNASFVGESLVHAGLDVRWVTSVGDREEDIVDAFQTAFGRARVVVVTGGLGPTHDDVTKKAASRVFGSPLVFRKEILDRIEALFNRRGKPLPASNEIQSWVPDRAEILDNAVGTAPGLLFTEEGRLFFLLPGVPAEAERLMRDAVFPRLAAVTGGRVFRSKRLKTIRIAESELADILQGFPEHFPDMRLAFLPQRPGVVLRLSLIGPDAAACDRRLADGTAFIRERAGNWIYGEDEDTIETIVAGLLISSRRTVSVAESCTGGLVSHQLTNVPGSSAYFRMGVVAYSNVSKVRLLGVQEALLDKTGAVSPETAAAMAEGIRHAAETDIGISITGIAGPSGGTPEKPVGLVYTAYADREQTATERHVFFQDRLMNKERSAAAALDLLRRMILSKSPNSS
jgi:nicotinamide-nucleotide amidase